MPTVGSDNQFKAGNATFLHHHFWMYSEPGLTGWMQTERIVVSRSGISDHKWIIGFPSNPPLSIKKNAFFIGRFIWLFVFWLRHADLYVLKAQLEWSRTPLSAMNQIGCLEAYNLLKLCNCPIKQILRSHDTISNWIAYVNKDFINNKETNSMPNSRAGKGCMINFVTSYNYHRKLLSASKKGGAKYAAHHM